MATERRTENYFSFLPFASFLVHVTAVATSYVVMVIVKGHQHMLVHPTDLTLQQPERGLFVAALSFGGSLTFAMMLLRYIQLNSLYPKKCRKLNIISFAFGILMVLSEILVAAFSPQLYTLLSMCINVAYFATAAGYLITQTHLSRRFYSHHATWLVRFRVSCCALSAIFALVYALTRFLPPPLNFLKQYKVLHLTEWLACALIQIFAVSFSWDFNRVRFRSYVLDKRHRDASVISTRESVRHSVNFYGHRRSRRSTTRGALTTRKFSDAISSIQYKHTNF